MKFESRLFMMREIYQEYMDFGPRDIPKSRDPFWDPPEAVEIGKAYVYLKALSQYVEIEDDFSIVDYKGDEQGQLSVEIIPEGPNGEELDYLPTSEELIGKPLTLLVRIPGAKGLPSKFNNDCHVNFTFLDQVKETEACEVKTSEPKWKFQTRFRFDSVTEEIRQYLLKEAAVFEVRGFSDPQVIAAAEESKSNAASADAGAAAAAASAPAAAAAAATVMCGQCSEKIATLDCKDCDVKFCDGCYALLHKSAKKAGHNKVALSVPGVASGAAKCVQCEENAAAVHCVDCDKNLCDGCNNLLHKSAKKADHRRNQLSAAPSALAAYTPDVPLDKCQQCEEQNAQWQCVECTKLLCDGCNNLLHKSAKKAEHTRIPVGGDTSVKCEQCDEQSANVKCEECGKKLCEGCNGVLHKSAKRATHSRTPL